MKWLALPLLAVVAGCASTAPVAVRTERIEVPVPVPCRAKMPDRPAVWAIDALISRGESTDPERRLFDRVQAMAVEIEQRRAYGQRLEAAVKACQ